MIKIALANQNKCRPSCLRLSCWNSTYFTILASPTTIWRTDLAGSDDAIFPMRGWTFIFCGDNAKISLTLTHISLPQPTQFTSSLAFPPPPQQWMKSRDKSRLEHCSSVTMAAKWWAHMAATITIYIYINKKRNKKKAPLAGANKIHF
jgi:hypothetical protein